MAQRTCSIEGCDRPVECRGWCHAHYLRWWRHGDAQAPLKRPRRGPDLCTVDGCRRPHNSHGLCNMHGKRWEKYGTYELPVKPPKKPRLRPRAKPRPALSTERFWSKVEKADGCWLWRGRTDRGGYGRLDVGHSKLGQRYWSAHRLAWVLTNGPIPPGLFVCHHCDNPPCCNPTHLFLGTNAENVADCVSKGRIARGSKAWMAKLTAEQALAIRALLADQQLTQKEIGARFGVTPGTVSAISRGVTWKHLP